MATRITNEQSAFLFELKFYVKKLRVMYGETHTVVKIGDIPITAVGLEGMLNAIDKSRTYNITQQKVLKKLRELYIQHMKDMRSLKKGDVVKVVSTDCTNKIFAHTEPMVKIGETFVISYVGKSTTPPHDICVKDENGFTYAVEDLIKI